MDIELDDDTLHELRRIYATLDPDRSGAITSDDLTQVFQEIGQQSAEEEIRNLMKNVDLNDDGSITFHEFLSLYKKLADIKAEEQKYREAFRICDCDDSGYITIDELKQIMTQVGENLDDSQLNALIQEVDINKDNRLDFEEFIVLMKKKI